MVTVPFWVRRALERNGVGLEELRGMSVEEMGGMEYFGPSVVRWVMEYFGRGDEVRDMGSSDEVLPGVSRGRVRQWRALRGTWRHFGAETREEFDALGVSDEEVARYILENTDAGFIENEGDGGDSKRRRGRGKKRLGEIRAEWERRVREYLERFDAPTPNDVAALRRLAFMDLRVELIQRRMLELVDEVGVRAMREMSSLNEQQVALSTEIRNLQKSLGIDRVRRVEEEERLDPLQVLRDGVRDAKWLMDNEIQEVVHYCADGKVVPIMAIWHWFPTHPHGSFRQQCPNCGEWFTVEYKPRGEAVSAKDFEIPDLLGDDG